MNMKLNIGGGYSGRKRQYKYDYLRAISCITVVLLHIAAMYTKADFMALVPDIELYFASFYRTIVQLAVPSFVMLSGAFLINDNSIEWKAFYKRMLYRIIIPTIVFSVIYVLVNYAESYLAFYVGIKVLPENKWEPLQNWAKGQPSVTMWYMYMIIGLYVITPVLVRIKKSISSKSYVWFGVGLFLYSILVTYTCTLSWILEFMQWIGYYVLGNVIYDAFCEKVDKKVGCGLIVLAYCMLSAYWYVYTFLTGNINIPDSFSAVVLIGVVLQFMGFSMLPNNNHIDKMTAIISKYSFEIYLIHPLFIEVLAQVSGRICKKFLPAQFIPLYTMIIVVLSCFVGIGYTKVMTYIYKKLNVKM